MGGGLGEELPGVFGQWRGWWGKRETKVKGGVRGSKSHGGGGGAVSVGRSKD